MRRCPPRCGRAWKDTFSDVRAAGAVDGTPATPGPGVRRVIDTGSKASTDGSGLVIAGSAASGDPSISYYDERQRRVPGRALYSRFSRATTNPYLTVVWAPGAITASPQVMSQSLGGTYFNGNSGVQMRRAGLSQNMWPGQAGNYDCVTLLRASTGSLAFVRPPGGSDFLLGGLSSRDDTWLTSPLDVRIAAASTPAMRVSLLGVMDTDWLPSPIWSDGLRREAGELGSTDGQGHREGALASVGAGGGGGAWNVVSGTWEVGPLGAQATAAGIALLPDVGTPDILMTALVTPPATGTDPAWLIWRYTDADNYWGLRLTPNTAGVDMELVQVQTGIATVLGSFDADWAAGIAYRLQVSHRGSAWAQAAHTDANRIAYTTNNAFNQTETLCGLRDEGAGNWLFQDVAVYAAGSEGQYTSYLEGLFA